MSECTCPEHELPDVRRVNPSCPEHGPELDALTLRELQETAHTMARSKGFYDQPGERNFGEVLALVHSELSEALESYRAGEPPHFVKDGKPEGRAVEMADAVIRIADYFGAMGWDLQKIVLEKIAFNATRGYRHGGKII